MCVGGGGGGFGPKNIQYRLCKDFRGFSFDLRPPVKGGEGGNEGRLKRFLGITGMPSWAPCIFHNAKSRGNRKFIEDQNTFPPRPPPPSSQPTNALEHPHLPTFPPYPPPSTPPLPLNLCVYHLWCIIKEVGLLTEDYLSHHMTQTPPPTYPKTPIPHLPPTPMVV